MKHLRRHPLPANQSKRVSRDELRLPDKPRPRNEPEPSFTEEPANHSEIIFGIEPVRELIAAAPSRIRILYVKSGAEQRFAPLITATGAGGGRVISIDGDRLHRMAGSEARHQGIIAAVREYEYSSLEHILALQPDPLLIVDGVTDPRNLGAIMRSAECGGLKAIVLARDHTVGVTPSAVKSSAGAWAHLTVARCGNVAQTLKTLKERGYWIAALAPDGETSLYDLDTSRRLAIVVGSEGGGIRPIVRKTSDFVVRIPQHGRVASLNVSVAAAIALFEIGRKRVSSSA